MTHKKLFQNLPYSIFAIIAISVSSQSIMVTGTVIDETNEVMPEVTVKVEGKDKGTTTI